VRIELFGTTIEFSGEEYSQARIVEGDQVTYAYCPDGGSEWWINAAKPLPMGLAWECRLSVLRDWALCCGGESTP
jgi:hypothetical protein